MDDDLKILKGCMQSLIRDLKLIRDLSEYEVLYVSGAMRIAEGVLDMIREIEKRKGNKDTFQ